MRKKASIEIHRSTNGKPYLTFVSRNGKVRLDSQLYASDSGALKAARNLQTDVSFPMDVTIKDLRREG